MGQINNLIDSLEENFRLSSDLENSIAMSKYMKDRFVFYGVKSPKRKEIQRYWIKNLPKDLTIESRWELVKELWNKNEREFQYVAIDWLNNWNSKFISISDSENIKWLITNKSWWDSVDSIAGNYLGKYCKKYPESAKNLIADWRESGNIWLQRSCLIFQLKYRENVDFELLKSLIIQFYPNKEFFIQKAIGWALRQYSKSNPEAVRTFINEINLQGLALREGSKYI